MNQNLFFICSTCKGRIPLIEGIISDNGIKVKIKCVCCDEEKNIGLTEYMEEVKKIKPEDNCSKEHDKAKKALAYCKLCKEFFCKDCLKTHNKLRANHSNGISFMKIDNSCNYHSHCELELYCLSCKVSICPACIDNTHYKHDIVNRDYFNKKISYRKLYEKYALAKTQYQNFQTLYSLVIKFIEDECDTFPYVHDLKSRTPLTMDGLNELYSHYTSLNDLIIDYVGSLFATSQVEKTNVNALCNLTRNSIFNPLPIASIEDLFDSLLLSRSNVKEYLQVLIAQMHVNVISPNFAVDIVDYSHCELLSSGNSKIVYLYVLNDKDTIAAITKSNSICFYSSKDKKLIHKIKGAHLTQANIFLISQLANGNLIFITEHNEVILFNYYKFATICSFTVADEDSRINHIVEYDDSCLAISSSDNIIRLYDLEKGVELHHLTAQIGITSIIKISQNFIASSGCIDGSIMIWETTQGECVECLKAHDSSVMLLSKIENLFLSAASDGSVKIWEINGFKCIKELRFESEVSNICEMNGEIALSERGSFRVWIYDMNKGELTKMIRKDSERGIMMLGYIKENVFVSDEENKIDMFTYEK